MRKLIFYTEGSTPQQTTLVMAGAIIAVAKSRTAQGSSNITVNYANTGRANFQIDRTESRGRHLKPDSDVIDFGKEDDASAEFTVTNQGCAAGKLTILKSGLHEDKLALQGGPFTVEPGERKVVRLQWPNESFFLGARDVTLLIRQDDATIDNVVVRWAGLSLLP